MYGLLAMSDSIGCDNNKPEPSGISKCLLILNLNRWSVLSIYDVAHMLIVDRIYS